MRMSWERLAFGLAVVGSMPWTSAVRTRSQSDGNDRVRLEDVKVRVADRFTPETRTHQVELLLFSFTVYEYTRCTYRRLYELSGFICFVDRGVSLLSNTRIAC